MTSPRVTVVVVSYNTRTDLQRCVASVLEAPPTTPCEVVVVDNASSDGSAEMARAVAGVRVIDAGANLGFAKANNLAIRATSGDLVLLLNSDACVTPGAIDRLVAELDRHPEAAVVGPRLVDGAGRTEVSFGPMISPWGELWQKLRTRAHRAGVPVLAAAVEAECRTPGEREWVSGACLLVRRPDAEAVGLLDERYFMYAEDVDFCAAIRELGRTVRFVPEAEVIHLRGRSGQTAGPATSRAYRRSQIAFYEKHHPAWAPMLRGYLRLRGLDPDAA